MAEGGVSYQAAVLPEAVLEKLTVDDTPDIFYNYFWEFMGVDIQNAYIQPWDFENILDMVDIKIAEIFQEYPEEQWDKIVIVSYKTYVNEVTKQVVKEPQHAFHLTILWNAMKAKLYVKMCRAREGFALKQVTEAKGTINQTQRIEGGGMQLMQPQEEKKRWKL